MANERRLIDIATYENMVDASVCQIQVYRSGNGYCDVMNFNTKNIPTLDAVEVVRCKNCVYFQTQANDWGFGFTVCNKEHGGMLAPCPDDFCSYGERRCE